MTRVFKLFGAECINRELSFYMIQGVVNKEAATALTPTRHQLIKDVASNALELLDCMNIPKHALYAPIAADYVKYNSKENLGEVFGAKM